MKKWRVCVAALSLTVVLSGGAFMFQANNWAQYITQPSEAPVVQEQKPLILDADLIRVGISNDAMIELEYPGATISATGPFNIKGKSSGKLLLYSPGNQNIRITKSAKGFLLEVVGAGVHGPFNEVLSVIPVNSSTRLKVTSVTRKGIIPTYRGIFEITPGHSGANKFTVVNVLPLQDYLKAVVPNELPYSYGYEAVKAQAVAARNYAIRPREKPWPQFDICDSQYCQAYYGANTEHSQTTKAILETQGLVALYKGEPILALYSSSHGGYSENYELAFSDPKTHRFPGTPIEYLRGGPDNDEFRDLTQEEEARAYYSTRAVKSFDIHSPNFRWQKQWSRQELESIINKNLTEVSNENLTKPFVKPAFPKGGSIGQLKELKVTERGVSGKIVRMNIVGTNGTWTLEKEFVIRKVLKHGGRFLPSANVVFDHNRDSAGSLQSVRAIGGGFGHGVGMSQLGASYLSRNGRSFTDILQHYYKGVSLGTIPLIARASQGMKTEFYVQQPRGTLHVQSNSKEPVKLAINDSIVEIKPQPNEIQVLDVASYLKPHSLNQLKILPLQHDSQVKAWIELVSPKITPSHPKTDEGDLSFIAVNS